MLLGDMIATMTGWMGIKPCEPCKQRQAALNTWHTQMTGRVQMIERVASRTPPAPIDTFVIEANDGQLVNTRR